MNILHITTTFYPAWAYGGIARVSYELCKELADRGHNVTVFTTDVYDRNNRVRHDDGHAIVDGINVCRFRNISNLLAWKRIHMPPSSILAAKQRIEDFDVLHFHGFESVLHVSSHYYAKKYGIPYVLQAHGSLVNYSQRGNLTRLFDKVWGYRILKDATRLIALTSTEAEQYKNIGIGDDKIDIVPNGINLSEFESLPKRGEFRKKYGLNNNQKVILYLGRIHKIKGLDLLAKAFAGIARHFDDAKLVIVGPDDGYLASLKR